MVKRARDTMHEQYGVLESQSNAVLGEKFTRAILIILVKPGLLSSYSEEEGVSVHFFLGILLSQSWSYHYRVSSVSCEAIGVFKRGSSSLLTKMLLPVSASEACYQWLMWEPLATWSLFG